MIPAFQELLDAPDAPLRIARAQATLRAEAAARQRFRDTLRPDQKGEFINGALLMHSPARHSHNHTSSLLVAVLGAWTRLHAGGVLVHEKALCSFSRNDYEPDIAWFGPDKAATITPATTLYPVPDFIIEILSPATEQNDRGVKSVDYASHGVAEYWLVDPDLRAVEQYLLPAGSHEHRLAEKLTHGDIRPHSFPGLTLPLDAIFETAPNLALLRAILLHTANPPDPATTNSTAPRPDNR